MEGDIARLIERDLQAYRRQFVENQHTESDAQRREAQGKLQELVRARAASGTDSPQNAILAYTARSNAAWESPLQRSQSIPQYKSWVYLPKNELASRVGHKMFYTDSTGETVPASESDDESRKDGLLEGVYQERERFAIRKVVQKHGNGEVVLEKLFRLLAVSSAVMKDILGNKTETGRKHISSHVASPPKANHLDCMRTSFCRFCQIFCCSLHPHEPLMPCRQIHCTDIELASPCGVSCWLHETTAADPDIQSKLPAETLPAVSNSPFDEAEHQKEDCVERKHDELSNHFSNQSLPGFEAQVEDNKSHSSLPAEAFSGYFRQIEDSEPAPTRPKAAASRRGHRNQVARKRAQHKQSLWEAFVPCNCRNGCSADCPCFSKSQFCEKYCACNKDCTHFFQGCVCTSGCRFKSCPCAAAGFECDPDLCQGCRCAALGGEPSEGKERCQNMRMRMRAHKRIAIGLSDIAGWGAFIMEPVKRNELIGEYTGELIDQDEAERRGKVYDKDDNSYLFNLNISWVIDARLQGNKLRFANHSKEPNCMAKILVVNGSHRVGIYAAKDMLSATELTYDYLYTAEQAPDWARD